MTKKKNMNDKIRYENLKQELNSILSQLSLAIEEGNRLKNELNNSYTINDGATPALVRTSDFVNNLTNTYNYIQGTIIPAIDAELSKPDPERVQKVIPSSSYSKGTTKSNSSSIKKIGSGSSKLSSSISSKTKYSGPKTTNSKISRLK